MTVCDLINELMLVKDKDMDVLVGHDGYFNEVCAAKAHYTDDGPVFGIFVEEDWE